MDLLEGLIGQGAALDTQIFAETGYGIYLNVDGGTSKGITITSAGNVGIGVTPVTKLDVVANSDATALTLRMRSTDDYSFLQFRNNAGTQVISEIYSNRTADNTGSLIFTTNNGGSATERMRITSDGNVGVGITGVYSNVRLMSRGVDATASNYALEQKLPAAANLMYIRNDGLIVTGLLSGSPYNYTTGSAANMYVSGGGELQRSTSSLKYKTDVRDYDKGL